MGSLAERVYNGRDGVGGWQSLTTNESAHNAQPNLSHM